MRVYLPLVSALILGACHEGSATPVATEATTYETVIDGAAKADDYEANQQASECMGKWIYTPPSMDTSKPSGGVGFLLTLDDSGNFEFAFSDYGNLRGKFSETGWDGQARTVLGNDGDYIEFCGEQTAEVYLEGDQYVEPRTFIVRRFDGDHLTEWGRFGWRPEQ